MKEPVVRMTDRIGRIYDIPKCWEDMFLCDAQDQDFFDSGRFSAVYGKFRVERKLKPKLITHGN